MAPKIKWLGSIGDLEIGDVVALSEDKVPALFVGIQFRDGGDAGVFLSRRKEDQNISVTSIPEYLMYVSEGAVVERDLTDPRYCPGHIQYNTRTFTREDMIFPKYDAKLLKWGL